MTWNDTRAGAVARVRSLPPLTAAATAMYGSGAVLLACAAITWQPGKNPRWVIASLAVLAVIFAAWALVRGQRFSQVEALTMVSLQLVAVVSMTWTTHLTFGALANGTVLPIVGAYAVWFLHAVVGRVVLYTGAAGWLVAVVQHGDSSLVPFAFTIVMQTVAATEVFARIKRRMDRLALTDPLTGTLNRRGITEVLDRELRRSARRGTHLSIVAIDLDGLREINNRGGHGAGDDMLEAVSRHWIENLRAKDSIGRTGGDEFLLVLPDTTLAQAEAIARRLAAGAPGSWSAGVAMAKDSDTAESMAERADRRLYGAKAARLTV